MFGGMLFGVLADTYGRRPVFIMTCHMYVIFGTLLYFVDNLVVFTTLRAAVGCAVQVSCVRKRKYIPSFSIRNLL